MGKKNTSCKTHKISCVPAVLDACYSFKQGESEILDGFKGKEIAGAIGCIPNVALNKLNPNNEHNVPTLKDAINLTDHFNDDRILQAWAHERGYLLVEQVEADEIDEEEVLDLTLNLSVKFGNLSHTYHKAREDGVIDPQEFEQIRKASLAMRKMVVLFENVLQTQVRELPQQREVIING